MKYRVGNTILLIVMFVAIVSCASLKKSISEASTKKNSTLTQDEKNRFDYYFFDSQRLKDIGQFDAQLEALRMCLSIDSMNGAAQSEYGLALTRLNQPAEAGKAFAKAVQLYPRNWWYRYQYITLLASRGMYPEAVEQAEQLKKYYPQRDFVYTLLSSLYKQTEDYQKAIDALNQLEQYMGINETLAFEKFQLYARLNKEKKAIAEIDRLVEKYPKETRYQVLRGDLFIEQNKMQKAYEIYQDVLRKDPGNPFVYVSLADYYKQTEQTDKAMASISEALKNPQLPSETKMKILGQYVDRLLSNNQKIEETEALFKILVEMYPLEELPHAYYALFLQNQKRNNEALEELETIISLNPKNEGAWKNYLQILVVNQDSAAIMDFTQKALQQIPHVPEFYFYRSIQQYQQGDYKSALKTAELAIRNTAETSTPDIMSGFYGQIGDLYFKMEERAKAFENYEKALALMPNNAYVMNNYAYYLSLEKKDLRKAERMSSKTVELEPDNSTYLDTYAWILYQQGDFMLAKIYIDRAVSNLKQDQEPEVVYEHAGDIYAALEKYNKAVEWWQKAYDATEKSNEEIKRKIEHTQLKNEDR